MDDELLTAIKNKYSPSPVVEKVMKSKNNNILLGIFIGIIFASSGIGLTLAILAIKGLL